MQARDGASVTRHLASVSQSEPYTMALLNRRSHRLKSITRDRIVGLELLDSSWDLQRLFERDRLHITSIHKTLIDLCYFPNDLQLDHVPRLMSVMTHARHLHIVCIDATLDCYPENL